MVLSVLTRFLSVSTLDPAEKRSYWQQVANLRKAYRGTQGAYFMDFPECEVKVKLNGNNEPEIWLEQTSQADSKARNLVAELMILGNEAFALVGELSFLLQSFRFEYFIQIWQV